MEQLTQKTRFILQSGSWYCRVPSDMVDFAGLSKCNENVDGFIRTETNKKGKKFLAIWKDGT